MKQLFLIFFIAFILQPLLAQDILINEFMSTNASVLQDEDGDYPDWIELYNSGSTTIQLQNYALSDDSTNLNKWLFPQLQLAAGEHLVVFASDKDRSLATDNWETIVTWGDEWRYFPAPTNPPSDWRDIGFDDTNWPVGKSGFGYGDDDDSTIVTPRLSLFIRHTFNIQDASDVAKAFLDVDYDDGFVAYLNGVEIARRNVGIAGGTPPTFDTPANGWREAEIYQGGYPERVATDEILPLLQNGSNVLTLQVHNQSQNSSDLSLIPFLTLAYFQQTPTRGVHPLIQPFLPGLHTNFKISSTGEALFLSDPNGLILDNYSPVTLSSNISYGREGDGNSSLAFFDSPTPGTANPASGFQQILQAPEPTVAAGFYSQPQQVQLTAPAGIIRYTLDGSEPNESSPTYTGTITVSSNTVLRTKAFQPGALPSGTTTSSYFINAQHNLTRISVTSAPENFFDNDSGIYVFGPNADPNFPYFGANFWQDWERPVNIEVFETDGSLAASFGAGAKIFGNYSRGLPQKSLSLFARGKYGNGSFDYPFFEDKPIQEFEAIILRNSGNDWNSTMFRDALLQQLIKDLDIDHQAYRPSVVYLNGNYWGIHNIREKINEHFIANNHDVDPDNVDLLELDGQIIEGNTAQYQQLITFLSTADLTLPANYEQVKRAIDIPSYCQYVLTQFYGTNTDWPGNNLKYWRPRTPDGKWRWILFDLDFSFGLFTPNAPQFNMIEFATEENGPVWPNPPWATLILRRLLTNPEFRQFFINTCSDLLNTTFEPASVVSLINTITGQLQSEMTNHFTRWGGDINSWNDQITDVKVFAGQRPFFMRQNFRNYFGLPGQTAITLDVSTSEAGSVSINSITPETFPWQGIYFDGNPVTLQANANPGYRFVGWSGVALPASDSVSYTPTGNSTIAITAVFEPLAIQNVVINEVNYNSGSTADPEDWVEFYNHSGTDLDLSGWYFSDEDDLQVFPLPAGTILEADSFLVICRDSSMFRSVFPNVENLLGNFSFGLSGGGELIRLFDSSGQIVDSLTYNDVEPWPTAPDGNGPTLSLLNPTLDNALPQSWSASIGLGTPGEQNDVFTGTGQEPLESIQSFQLFQNYPNPFNPKTTIRFTLPSTASIELNIYDISGRRVTTLANGRYQAGEHAVEWNPDQQISSGIYVYRLLMNNQNMGSRKLIFLR